MVDTYTADDIELLWQWERASHRRKQLTWLTGRMDPRRFPGLRAEQTDEEKAEETGGTDVIALPGETWEESAAAGGATTLLDAEVSSVPATARTSRGWSLRVAGAR